MIPLVNGSPKVLLCDFNHCHELAQEAVFKLEGIQEDCGAMCAGRLMPTYPTVRIGHKFCRERVVDSISTKVSGLK